jgi:hypothetical protein
MAKSCTHLAPEERTTFEIVNKQGFGPRQSGAQFKLDLSTISHELAPKVDPAAKL